MHQKVDNSCACSGGCGRRTGEIARRDFLATMPKVTLGASLVLGALERMAAADDEQEPQPTGLPKKPAVVKVGYLRPRGSEGSAWPGHGYNFDTWCAEYTNKLQKLGEGLGMDIVVGPDAMLYDGDPLTKFIEATKQGKPDALLLAPIGIGRWGRADQILKAVGEIPTLLFSPIGGSFSFHTKPFAKRPGCCLVTSDDINDVRDGLEMVKAAATLKQSIVVFLSGTERKEVIYGKLGTKLRYVPLEDYISTFKSMEITEPMRRIAKDYSRRAKAIHDMTFDGIVSAAKHYFATKHFLAAEKADGITSDCMTYYRRIGTPCLAYTKLNDEGIPAGCERDIGSMMALMLGRHLLERPGFMGDPFVDTAHNLFGNAHCMSPTKLDGYDRPSAEFLIRQHNAGKSPGIGMQILWRIGQVMTLARFQKADMLLVDRAKVVCNYEIPPAGTCVTSVGAVVDGAEDDPQKVGGFHVLQFYGDHIRKLRAYCQLYGIEAVHSWDSRVSFNPEFHVM